jgi:ribosomal protein S15P/S13E
MLRSNNLLLGKQVRVRGRIDLMGKLGAQSRITRLRLRELQRDSETGEIVAGRGEHTKKTTTALKTEFDQAEYPLVWMYYPWRRNPEPPTGSVLPCPNALKNLHGAVVTSLTEREQMRQQELKQNGFAIPETRTANHARKHPFLDQILKKTIEVKIDPATNKPVSASAVGFPFWYKMYPTRRHAYEYRFNIPKEMVLSYPPSMQKSLSYSNFSEREKLGAERARYIEKYAEHDLDTTSPAVTCGMLALKARNLRNHLLTNPHNNIAKRKLHRTETNLMKNLRRLRKIDFRKYWQLIQDHDIQDLIQPNDLVSYRWGKYWRYEWDSGLALSTNIADFMDPRGMNGCVETGRSRAEVSRDLGLSYTRPLSPNEKKHLSDLAMYQERLSKLRVENPEAWRYKGRQDFINKFTGMFTAVNWKSRVVDFPSRFRGAVGTTLTRWKSARHGPM